MVILSTGYFPAAVSPDSITASVPSKMALATSDASARVGRGLLIAGDLLNREEIIQARQGQAATAIRRVQEHQVLYAVAPVRDAEGQVAQIVYLAMPLPDTQLAALPAILRWQLAGALLVAILLSSIAGLLLSRRIVGPLGRLVNAAQAVAGGDLGQTVPEDPAITELAALGQAFNRMTTSLRQADLAKTAFISDVSHELRTPLTVIDQEKMNLPGT